MIVIVFPLAVTGFALAPPDVFAIAAIAACYGAANGMLTIVRGLAVPEMVSREAYGAINGALVAPMNVMQAIAPLLAAWIWSATGGDDAVLVAIGEGAVSLDRKRGVAGTGWSVRGDHGGRRDIQKNR